MGCGGQNQMFKFQRLWYFHRNIISYDLTFFSSVVSLRWRSIASVPLCTTSGFCFGFGKFGARTRKTSMNQNRKILFMNLNFVSGTQKSIGVGDRQTTKTTICGGGGDGSSTQLKMYRRRQATRMADFKTKI